MEIDPTRLPTPTETVRKLQTSLHAKAKAEPARRFHSLWDKVFRKDVLAEAYRLCRANRGAAGVDGETLEDIEAGGRERWLVQLGEEFRSKTYRCGPLLRVWIPKGNGGQRPLGIPTLRDRVAQMAMHLVLSPIFEADLHSQQYGFRPGLDAKMAVRRVYWHINDGRRDIVDGDLSDYFNTIPHGQLMRSIGRRIADGQILATIRQWLRAPVVERTDGRHRRTTEARDRKRGTPQGGVISPLLANIYFRRFMLAWETFGHRTKLDAHVINYADDFVICCKPGNGEAALTEMRRLVTGLGLTVNEKKTRRVEVPEESFDFLGYTIGRFFGRDGRPYLGTRPSRKAVSKLLRRIHDATSRNWYWTTASDRIAVLNPLLRGWCGYFNQGPVMHAYRIIRQYTERRVRRWLMHKHKRRGTGYRQYPDDFLYGELGLFKPPAQRTSQPNAKA
jgi:RNA-directed DNA polymerase